jgi:succinate-semialdehyde dehydrogenase/glutarate-semialdehyde dehydrogenase
VTSLPTDFDERLRNVRRLGVALSEAPLRERVIEAYMADTAFLRRDVVQREISTPSRLCSLPLLGARPVREGAPLGKVAVVVPKNSLGLTIAKAVVGSYLAGNETIVRLPGQLARTLPIYATMLQELLPGVSFAPQGSSGGAFLEACFRDPTMAGVVIYGDDGWIDPYRPLAQATGTKLVFEGPGNDPLVVLEDADLEGSVDAALRGGLHNGGQSCSAFERMFVHASILEAFTDRLVDRVAAMKIGSPEHEDVAIGPIASPKVLARLLRQLEDARSKGATTRFGGRVVATGYQSLSALEPTVLTGCCSDMAIVSDETFGAVFPLMSFSSIGELMPSLDATRYGLNAAVFGTCPAPLRDYLFSNHRNAYENSTPVDPVNLPTRVVDGGYRRSGFVWERRGDDYVTRYGRRFLAVELATHEPGRLPDVEALIAAAPLPVLPTELC